MRRTIAIGSMAAALAATALCGCSALLDNDPANLPYRDTGSSDTADVPFDGDAPGDSDVPLDGDEQPDSSTDGDTINDTDAAEDPVEEEPCVPDCAGGEIQCGPDPVCGTSCGECTAPLECNPWGVCLPGWVTVRAGAFLMGSPVEEDGRGASEDLHQVTLTHGFRIMATEVTQDQFSFHSGYQPYDFEFCGGDCPVEDVTWHQAAGHANDLSDYAMVARCYDCTGGPYSMTCTRKTEYPTPYDCPGYRLPTEAEWEYAARAGTISATYGGDLDEATLLCEMPSAVLDPIGRFCGNSGVSYSLCEDILSWGCCDCAGTDAVGTKEPNDWGLYDMLGNVKEWSGDFFENYAGDAIDPWGPGTGSSGILRGGAWDEYAWQQRAAYRSDVTLDTHDSRVGFRLVRTLPSGDWVEIPSGMFTMGSPGSEQGRQADETQHSVTLTHPFEMLATEVTQDQFLFLMGYDTASSFACGGDCPVDGVTWHEAAAYCNALSRAYGLDECYECSGTDVSVTCARNGSYSTLYECPGYRLPTEAEWEFAARGGAATATYNGDLDSSHLVCEQPNSVLDSIAWFCGNSSGTLHPAGTLAPNAYGLYDMLGSTWEWCDDAYSAYPGTVVDPWTPAWSGATMVLRSATWDHDASQTRAAYRDDTLPEIALQGMGFRPVRTL